MLTIKDIYEQVDALKDVEGNVHTLRTAIVVSNADYELMFEEAIIDSFHAKDPVTLKGKRLVIRGAVYTPYTLKRMDVNTLLAQGT